MRPLSLLVAFGGACLTLAGVFSVDEALQRSQLRQRAEQLIPERQPLCLEPDLSSSFENGGPAGPAAGPKPQRHQLRVMPCTTMRVSPLRLPMETSWSLVDGPAAARVVSATPAASPGHPELSFQLASTKEHMPRGDLSHRWWGNEGWLEIGRAHV